MVEKSFQVLQKIWASSNPEQWMTDLMCTVLFTSDKKQMQNTTLLWDHARNVRELDWLGGSSDGDICTKSFLTQWSREFCQQLHLCNDEFNRRNFNNLIRNGLTRHTVNINFLVSKNTFDVRCVLPGEYILLIARYFGRSTTWFMRESKIVCFITSSAVNSMHNMAGNFYYYCVHYVLIKCSKLSIFQYIHFSLFVCSVGSLISRTILFNFWRLRTVPIGDNAMSQNWHSFSAKQLSEKLWQMMHRMKSYATDNWIYDRMQPNKYDTKHSFAYTFFSSFYDRGPSMVDSDDRRHYNFITISSKWFAMPKCTTNKWRSTKPPNGKNALTKWSMVRSYTTQDIFQFICVARNLNNRWRKGERDSEKEAQGLSPRTMFYDNFYSRDHSIAP